jgi:hypothetical protein
MSRQNRGQCGHLGLRITMNCSNTSSEPLEKHFLQVWWIHMYQFWRGIWKCQNNQEARAAFLDFESLKIKRQFFSTLKGKFVVSLGIGHTVESLWHTDVTQFYIRKAHLNICLWRTKFINEKASKLLPFSHLNFFNMNILHATPLGCALFFYKNKNRSWL